jgi:hypothetical protein
MQYGKMHKDEVNFLSLFVQNAGRARDGTLTI